MVILGIESTCDETAAALVEDGRVLHSNVFSTSVKEQALYGGVVPEIASRRHCEFISATVDKALADAGRTIDQVDAGGSHLCPGPDRGGAGGGQLCQGPGLRRRQTPGAGPPSAGPHCGPLSDPPRAEAPLLVPGGLGGPQPHCPGGGLHQIPGPGPDGGRRRRRGLRQGGPDPGPALPRRPQHLQCRQDRQPQSLPAAGGPMWRASTTSASRASRPPSSTR